MGKCRESADQTLEALKNLLRYTEGSECQHEETRRAGAIWTICVMCRKKWADDEGGFVPYTPPKEIDDAYEAIKNAEGLK